MALSKPAVFLLGAAALLCPAAVSAADVTVTITTSIEGGLAAGPSNTGMTPKVVTKISGAKSRTDVDTGDQVVTTIIDTGSNQMYVLRPADKTALLLPVDAAATGQPSSTVAAEVKPTGRTRDIEGVTCAEFSVLMKMNMAAVAGGAGSSLPPEATAMLKDVFLRIEGSSWVAKDAPGAAEYATFQKAAARAAMAALSRVSASGGASSPIPGGMERLFTGFPEAAGIPYLTELTTAVEGTGQFVPLLQGMAQMKIVSRVTSVSTEPVAADAFAVPEGYSVVKN